jgi:drug/metabolite transporter (DMT)-like permease
MPEWLIPGLAEGFFMGIVKLFGHAGMGRFVPTIADVLFAVGLVGLMQASLALAILLARRRSNPDLCIVEHGGYVVRSIMFGAYALFATICAFAAFQNGARADVGANTFIVAVLPIFATAIFGAVISRKESLDRSQLCGLGIALVGSLLVTMPALRPGNSWVWILYSLGTMLGATATRLEAQDIVAWGKHNGLPKLDPWVMQLWGGAVLALALPLSLPWIDFHGLTLQLAVIAFWGAAIVTAGGQAIWWTCRLYAVPKDGTPLCIKELGAGTLYLATATFGGVLFAGDALPPAKIVGFALFFPAFFLAQGQAREYCRKHFFAGHPAVGISPATDMPEMEIPVGAK